MHRGLLTPNVNSCLGSVGMQQGGPRSLEMGWHIPVAEVCELLLLMGSFFLLWV